MQPGQGQDIPLPKAQSPVHVKNRRHKEQKAREKATEGKVQKCFHPRQRREAGRVAKMDRIKH